MNEIREFLRGYTDEQFTIANISLLAAYLSEKNIINQEDFKKFYEANINETINATKEAQNKIIDDSIKKYNNERKKDGETHE